MIEMPRFAQIVSDLIELFAFATGERGGWFVHDENAHILRKRFCDFYQLLLRYGKHAHALRRANVAVQGVEKFFCLSVSLFPTDRAKFGKLFMAHKNVFGHGKVRICAKCW